MLQRWTSRTLISMIYLADVNVWIALTLSYHKNHSSAIHWLLDSPQDQIAFCRVTQMGFLRLLTNRAVMDNQPLGTTEAWELFDEWLDGDGIGFVPEPQGLE